MFLYMKDIDLLCMRRIFVLLFVLMTCGFIFAKSSINEKKHADRSAGKNH